MDEDRKHRLTATLTTEYVLRLDEYLGGLTLTQKLISILDAEETRKRKANSEPTVFDK